MWVKHQCWLPHSFCGQELGYRLVWVLLRAVVSQVAVTCSSLKACWQVQRLSSMRFWLEASLIPVHSGGVGGRPPQGSSQWPAWRRWECQQCGLGAGTCCQQWLPSPLVSLVRDGIVLMVGFEEQIVSCCDSGNAVWPSHFLCSPVYARSPSLCSLGWWSGAPFGAPIFTESHVSPSWPRCKSSSLQSYRRMWKIDI